MTTWFITGCSTGLGRALAEAVLAAVTTRSSPPATPPTSRTSPTRNPDRASPWPSTSPTRSRSPPPSQQAEERFGGIDVLVNNAGYGYRAAVEEGDDADVRDAVRHQRLRPRRLIKAVLPGMRARRTGTIVNISSIGARIGRPAPATTPRPRPRWKACPAPCTRRSQPLGITVMVVEPGAFRTDFAGRSLTQSATDRRLRRHRRQAPQGARHRARHPARRPGQGRAGDHRRRRVRPSHPRCCCSAPTPSRPSD